MGSASGGFPEPLGRGVEPSVAALDAPVAGIELSTFLVDWAASIRPWNAASRIFRPEKFCPVPKASVLQRWDALNAQQPTVVVMAMAGALLGMGSRSVKLHTAALRVAKKIGPIDFDPDGKCAPFDVAKNLSHRAIKEKLKRQAT